MEYVEVHDRVGEVDEHVEAKRDGTITARPDWIVYSTLDGILEEI